MRLIVACVCLVASLGVWGVVVAAAGNVPPLQKLYADRFDKTQHRAMSREAEEYARGIPTNDVAVKLKPDTNPDEVAARYGFVNRGQVGTLPNTFLFRMEGSGVKRDDVEAQSIRLRDDTDVAAWYPQRARQQVKK